jgi:ribosomal protein L11 methylase PrmA
MTEDEIAKAINPKFVGVYAPTYTPTTLYYKDGSIKAGYFQPTSDSDELKKRNIFTFIEFRNVQEYRATKDKKFITLVKGDDLLKVFSPQLVVVKYDQVFTINANNTISPKLPVKIGSVTITPGVSFGSGVIMGGVNLFDYIGRTLEGYVDNGMFVIYRIL